MLVRGHLSLLDGVHRFLQEGGDLFFKELVELVDKLQLVEGILGAGLILHQLEEVPHRQRVEHLGSQLSVATCVQELFFLLLLKQVHLRQSN